MAEKEFFEVIVERKVVEQFRIGVHALNKRIAEETALAARPNFRVVETGKPTAKALPARYEPK